ncbi:MAG: hypothetical protein ACRC0G_04250 [Fusobacteriaceae bacterium]
MSIIYEDDFERIETDNKNQIRYYNKQKNKYNKMTDKLFKEVLSGLEEQGITLTFNLNVM